LKRENLEANFSVWERKILKQVFCWKRNLEANFSVWKAENLGSNSSHQERKIKNKYFSSRKENLAEIYLLSLGY
jgi:hypothetical protein